MTKSNDSVFRYGNGGWSTKDRATATCFCGAVQLSFPTEGEDLVATFACHCTDERKITGTMLATNFIVDDSALKHERGEERLTRFAQSKTIQSGRTMANSFCSNCGSLMYRRSSGFPGKSILRLGTVDDFTLHETKLKPQIEQFISERVSWLEPAKGIAQDEGSFFDPRKPEFGGNGV
ncbi:hypothetical protein LTR36_001401 [Oleoguttula mirabilis]|uniref:CENP-V/GFA domain-containing protein n=1 Tax=Oleoguttula mirabilis TaxID=1507867 RepID=A0AAV9JP79_9PEZI|nr:hypothetical protein LTR36_001401 [Oleoguttula mirabilis]